MTSFAELLQQHRAAYVESLPKRLVQLEVLAGQLEDPARQSEALTALERCAHSLAGSAGTFGFTGLGEVARSLELLLDEEGAAERRTTSILDGVVTLRQHLNLVLHVTAHAEGAR